MRIFLDGKKHQEAVTADPSAGIIEIHIGTQMVALIGYVEVKLVRD